MNCSKHFNTSLTKYNKLISSDIICYILDFLEGTFHRIASIVFKKFIDSNNYRISTLYIKDMDTKNLIIWALENKCRPTSYFTVKSASYGDINLVEYVIDRGCSWHNKVSVSVSAVKSGNIGLLRFLHKSGCPWNEFTSSAAVECNRLDMLKYMRRNGCPWNEYIFSIAAIHGYLDIIQYAHKHNCPWNFHSVHNAFSSGHLDVVKYFYINNYQINLSATYYAAINGHHHILKYYYTIINNLNDTNNTSNKFLPNILTASCSSGNLNLVKWLLIIGAPVERLYTFNTAVIYGHLDIVKYFHKYIPGIFNKRACSIASSYGKLNVLKYLLRNGCKYYPDVCELAAYHGHLDCLKYAHNFGCPLTIETFNNAAYKNFIDIIKYLHKNNCPIDKEKALAYVSDQQCRSYIKLI